MDKLKFSDHIDNFIKQGVFFAKIERGISDKNELFNELRKKLIFPDYFGNNWDALNDCMNSLDWINEKKIVIFHEKLPEISKEELFIYLKILVDAKDFFTIHKDKEIDIVFPEKDKNLIYSLFQN